MKNSINAAYNPLYDLKVRRFVSSLLCFLNILAVAIGVYTFICSELPNSEDSTSQDGLYDYFNIQENNEDVLSGKLLAQFVISIDSLCILFFPVCCVFYFAFSNKMCESIEEKLLYSFEFADYIAETDHTKNMQSEQTSKYEESSNLDHESMKQVKQLHNARKSEYLKKYVGLIQNNHDRFDSVSTACDSPFDDSVLQASAKNAEEKAFKCTNQESKSCFIVRDIKCFVIVRRINEKKYNK